MFFQNIYSLLNLNLDIERFLFFFGLETSMPPTFPHLNESIIGVVLMKHTLSPLACCALQMIGGKLCED
jgi:hypothetical protein